MLGLGRLFGRKGTRERFSQEESQPAAAEVPTMSGMDNSVAADFQFGPSVKMGQDVMIGFCHLRPGEGISPCSWRIQEADEGSTTKYRVIF
jgi:hypothetical protein